MDLILVLIYTGVAIVFSAFLINVGLKMYAVKSYKKLIVDYRKHPKRYGWFEHYFLGFRLFNARPLEWSIEQLGDTMITVWYRFSGILFILFAIFFIMSTVVNWYFYLA